MRTLIRGGTLVTAADTCQADLLIDGERIAAVGSDLATLVSADTVVDAAGLLVLPGGIDVHTHLDMPAAGGITSSDDYYTGTVAAAMGGTTTIIDIAEPVRGAGDSLLRVLEAWHGKAEGKAVIDYAFHSIIAELLPGMLEDELPALIRAGVTSFKLFTAYTDSLMLSDSAIFRIMRRCADLGALVTVHAENGGVIDVLVAEALARGHRAPRTHADTRPVLAEDEATYRAICLAELAGCPLHIVHVSTGNAADHIRAARGRGLPVHGETCPQYLFLDDSCYDDPAFDRAAGYVMSPPLRPAEHRDRLWRALGRGDLDAVATDHCPFCLAEKRRGADDFTQIPNGAPGIEQRMALIYDGGVRPSRISLNQYVELTATRPARLFGLYPRKGTLAIGSDADLLLFDPAAEQVLSARTHHARVDYNPYEGRRVTGVPRQVYSRGELIARDGRPLAAAGRGRFLRRGGYHPL